MRFGERLLERRREALARQAERDERGDAGQLRQLERGGHGDCKEAARLRKRIAKAKK
jgi:hypothetical protein